ncbi:2-hydroxyacid dehydrogenase [Pseudomonas luteola]
MAIGVLLTQPLPAPIAQELQERYDVFRLYETSDPDAMIKAVGSRIRAVVTGGAKGLSNDLMDRLPLLDIIAISGVGTDAVDLAYARQKGIKVTTTPGVLTDDVADMAIGLIIMTLRGLATGDRIVRNRQWGKVTQSLARKVSGTRLGIVGLGQVGHAIAKRAKAFGMDIFYHDLNVQPESIYQYVETITRLAGQVDILVLAASADQKQPIITAEVLDALGPQGYFINIARGKLVEETALVTALKTGMIAGAGLDVFAEEPYVPDALLTMEQVVLQPHRASATEQTRLAMGHMVLANLEACFSGRCLPTAVA